MMDDTSIPAYVVAGMSSAVAGFLIADAGRVGSMLISVIDSGLCIALIYLSAKNLTLALKLSGVRFE